MKRVAFAFALFIAFPALAQTPPAPPEQQAWQILYSREVQAHAADVAGALQMQAKIADMNRELDAATKELAALKAPPPPK